MSRDMSPHAKAMSQAITRFLSLLRLKNPSLAKQSAEKDAELGATTFAEKIREIVAY